MICKPIKTLDLFQPIKNDGEVRQQIFTMMTAEYKGSEKNFPIMRKMIDFNPQGMLDVLNLTLNRLDQEQVQRFIEILLKIAKVSLFRIELRFIHKLKVSKSARGLILLFVGRQLVQFNWLYADKFQTDLILG